MDGLSPCQPPPGAEAEAEAEYRQHSHQGERALSLVAEEAGELAGDRLRNGHDLLDVLDPRLGGLGADRGIARKARGARLRATGTWRRGTEVADPGAVLHRDDRGSAVRPVADHGDGGDGGNLTLRGLPGDEDVVATRGDHVAVRRDRRRQGVPARAER